MMPTKVHSFEVVPRDHMMVPVATPTRGLGTAKRMLLAAWVGVGLIPFLLQARSFLKFATPHKINETLVAPSGAERETANLTELCPATGFLMAQTWWNIVATHYYEVEHGRICHVVVPQYNMHGGYRVGSFDATPFHTTPESCIQDSYTVEQYLYHGSFGYYAFYEEAKGTYCSLDRTVYALVNGVGTYDINGWFLAQDAGGTDSRRSYWYGTVGTMWLIYRALVLRRSYISCNRYARTCDEMGEVLWRKPAMVFVHEKMRLSAHGANNFQRLALLYLIIEGLMSDLFLLIAHDGIFAQMQYISIGYNLSGLLLLLWEIVENVGWLKEKWRMLIKRLLFSYESSLLGEMLSAAVQQHFLVSLNRSDLKESKPTALAVSYYVWSLLWHTVYRLEGDQLFYKAEALKAFGVFKAEEGDGSECLVLNKLDWISVPADNLVVIGTVLGRRCVKLCPERPCTGVVSFFSTNLGGAPGSERAFIGFYSFYEEVAGTYCAKDGSMYGLINGLGTFDINGTIWIAYRAVVLRRSYVACKLYGRRCERMGEELKRRAAMVFVHENMRLSAHGATNYHRVVLLYLLVEGIMSDLFLLVATDGIFAWFQYISFGYNLSGVLLILFEIVENMGWLREKPRLFIKRLLFCYESSLVGELLSAIGQSYMLTSLSHSVFRHSGFVARAVSYYVWSLVGHSIIVLTLAGFILAVRTLRAITYARWKHGHFWAIFTTPCSVDTTLAMRNKMTLLTGYLWDKGQLCYKPEALKSFGLLKMQDEDGMEFLAMRKLHWFQVPKDDFVVIGIVSEQCVKPCPERPSTGVASFFDRNLGAAPDENEQYTVRSIHVKKKVVIPS
ncbi:uncharacterized protein KRP23_11565 [Phytophthora ramorum]|uniref:uncharacterized protein n=1 Tax=Phytophthora ramorum TaxID=164328 RepID=UPI0030A5C63A|nr:hypothetical protein KRP23_11565 [Phytophthora ramorum]